MYTMKLDQYQYRGLSRMLPLRGRLERGLRGGLFDKGTKHLWSEMEGREL